jgi:hypothetical protein
VEVTSLHGFIYENAARYPVRRRCSQILRFFRMNTSCRLPANR